MIGVSKSISGFDPRSIPGCQLWFDAADASKIVTSGTNVTSWTDKVSGIALTTPYTPPTYVTVGGTPAVYFNNPTSLPNGQLLQNTSASFSVSPGCTLIVASLPTSNDNYRNAFTIQDAGVAASTGGNYYGIQAGASDGNTYGYLASGGASWTVLTEATAITRLIRRVDVAIGSAGSTSGTLYTNSVQNTSFITNTTGTAPSATVSSGNQMIIGGTSTFQGSRCYAGYVFEVLFYNAVLTTAQRQQVEGYLAWKWGTKSTNPFAALGLTPQFWFDSSDATTITGSGASLVISNKGSTTGSNITVYTGTPTTATQNGLNTTVLASGAVLKFTGAFATAPRARFIATKTTTASSGQVQFLFQNIVATSGNDYIGISGSQIIEVAQGNIVNMTCSTIPDQNGTFAVYTAVNASTNTSNLIAITGSNVSLTTNNAAGSYNVASATNYINNAGSQNLGEFVSFTNDLTLAQAQYVEGYLAWKWGVQIYLPSTHPYYSASPVNSNSPNLPFTHPFFSVNPFSRVFSLTDISGCSLWLDGADSSTLFQDTAGATPVTANGQLVSRWKDKSSNGFAFTTGTGGTAPTYNTNALNSVPGVTFGSTESSTVFSTNYKWLDSASTINCYTAFTSGGSNTTIFAVVNVNAVNQHNRLFGNTINLDMEILYPWTGVGFIWDQPYNSAANRLTNTYSVTGGQMICALRSGANMTAYSNGTSFASISTATGTLTNSASTVKIGGMSNASDSTYYTFNSNICEMVIYNRDLTTTERQQVEGYLAWKWKLNSSLASTQPFKTIPPSTVLFLPTQIAGCSLWIDAADSSRFTLSGTTVKGIIDKSGAGSTVTTFDLTTVTYEPTGLSGKPSFNMVSAHFRGSIGSTNPITKYTNTTFVVTQLISTPSGNGYPCMALAEAATGSATYYRVLDYSTTGPSFRQVAFFGTTPVTSNAAQVGTPFIMNTNYSGAAAGNTLFMRYNGSTAGVTVQTVATAPTTNPTNFFIGSDGSTSGYNGNFWTGRISEVIMYNSQLTIAQQMQVEGYLAWKWGLQTSLPSTHPYSKFSP